MPRLRQNTDRDHFVTVMLELKAASPEAYEVMLQQARAIAGIVKLDTRERADLVRRFRACAPDHPKIARMAMQLDAQLAEVAL